MTLLIRPLVLSNYELHFIGDIADPILDRKLKSVFAQHMNLVFHGYQSMRNAWKICNQCDVGLAILDPKDNYMESYPTKLFEYLICGLPIVTSNFELYRNLVERYNVGFCVNPYNVDEISNSLREIVDKHKYSDLTSSIALFPFNNFTWECEFKKFTHYLRQA